MNNTQKNWLIRTQTNQILGPITKEKLMELLKKGALNERDEICSGPGYWFYVKEKELLDRFVWGDELQGHNPVTETVDVLTADSSETNLDVKDRHANLNEMDEVNDITNVINVKNLKKEVEFPNPKNTSPSPVQVDTSLPSDSDLEFPDITLVSKVTGTDSTLSTTTMASKKK